MRLNGRQARFLLAVFVCWSAGRAYQLASHRAAGAGARAVVGAPPALGIPQQTPVIAFHPAVAAAFSPAASRYVLADEGPKLSDTRSAMPVLDGGRAVFAEHPAERATLSFPPSLPTPAPAPLFPLEQPQPQHARIEAQAYLFWRPGGEGRSLAERGELGGSQIAARIAMPIGHRVSVAARAYAPLRHPGAEGAIGLDWHPINGVPLRLSVERRQRFDPQGRSAWSAYVAGGFYKGGGPGTVQVDGYGQAGVVGAQRKDAFIDGALRLGYRLPTQKMPVVVGAGLWGAAQPQVSRIDAGPRISIVLPVDRHSLTFAVDGRFRLAGQAAPASGAAFTLAADF